MVTRGRVGEMPTDGAQIRLARRCPGNRIDDHNVGGNLIARQSCSQKLQKIRGVGSSPIAKFHHRNGRLPEPFVRLCDHRRTLHRGVAFQRVTHVVRYHLETAADDRLVGSSSNSC